MIDYRDCIVPEKPFRRGDIYEWVAYSGAPPYLAVASAPTAERLAKKMGVSTGTVTGSWQRYQCGQLKRTRYHKVKVGAEG